MIPTGVSRGGVLAERFGVEGVERAHDGASQISLFLLCGTEPVRWIENRVVDTHLVDPLREE